MVVTNNARHTIWIADRPQAISFLEVFTLNLSACRKQAKVGKTLVRYKNNKKKEKFIFKLQGRYNKPVMEKITWKPKQT